MEWLKKLEAAIDYIEANLDKEISYDEAARIACCSPYYFQRIFSYVSGVSLAEYIRRRKMTQAAFELQRTDEKVIDLSLKYGYSSPTSFHRAFQKLPFSGYKYAELPDIEVYPICNGQPVHGHSEVWIAIKEEGR